MEKIIQKAIEIAKIDATREGVDCSKWGMAFLYKNTFDMEIIISIKNANLMLVIHCYDNKTVVNPAFMLNGKIEMADSYKNALAQKKGKDL